MNIVLLGIFLGLLFGIFIWSCLRKEKQGKLTTQSKDTIKSIKKRFFDKPKKKK